MTMTVGRANDRAVRNLVLVLAILNGTFLPLKAADSSALPKPTNHYGIL